MRAYAWGRVASRTNHNDRHGRDTMQVPFHIKQLPAEFVDLPQPRTIWPVPLPPLPTDNGSCHPLATLPNLGGQSGHFVVFSLK